MKTKQIEILDNAGIIPVEKMIYTLRVCGDTFGEPDYFLEGIDEIGNHKGDWTIHFNEKVSPNMVELTLDLISTIAYFDHWFNINVKIVERTHEDKIFIDKNGNGPTIIDSTKITLTEDYSIGRGIYNLSENIKKINTK